MSNASTLCKSINSISVKSPIVIEWSKIIVLSVNLDILLIKMDPVKLRIPNV